MILLSFWTWSLKIWAAFRWNISSSLKLLSLWTLFRTLIVNWPTFNFKIILLSMHFHELHILTSLQPTQILVHFQMTYFGEPWLYILCTLHHRKQQRTYCKIYEIVFANVFQANFLAPIISYQGKLKPKVDLALCYLPFGLCAIVWG